MKRVVTVTAIIIFLVIAGLYGKRRFYDPKQRLEKVTQQVAQLYKDGEIRSGDIIFQTSLSGQSKAIQLATHSEYSHCGIIYKNNNDYFVYEAVEPVRFTPLNKWISRGQDGHFVIKRLKNADQILTPAVLNRMNQVEEKYKGRHYDIYFEWTNDKMYCSELIWKVYKESTGIEICKLEKLKDFDLTSDPVKQKMKERYGDRIPLDETVVSPAGIYKSRLLEMVKSN